MTTSTITARRDLPLLISALTFAALTVAYVAVNAGVPRPDATGAEVLAYGTNHSGALELGALLMLCAAPVLSVTGALMYRLSRHRTGSVPGIAAAGGLLGAGALTASAVFAWAGAQLAPTASPDLARSIADMGFVTGGPAYAVGFGLLAAGIATLGQPMPRPLAWIGLAIAAAAALSTIGLAVPGFLYLLPLVRFGGLLWLLVTAVMLSRR